jgi:hypothetical protein
MKVEHAAWFACDILPVNNIDKAARTLLKELWRLQEKYGEPKTIPKITTPDGKIDPEASVYP